MLLKHTAPALHSGILSKYEYFEYVAFFMVRLLGGCCNWSNEPPSAQKF